MKSINLRPLDDRIVVEPMEAEEVTAGGIVLPDSAQEKPQRGTVIAVGPGKLLDSGQRGELSVSVGDEVIYGKYTDLMADAKQRVESHPDRYEPKIYGEDDAGGTQVLHLSAAGIPFEKLGLPKLGTESQPHLSEAVQHGVYKGFIAPVVLYVLLGGAIWRSRRAEKKANEEVSS